MSDPKRITDPDEGFNFIRDLFKPLIEKNAADSDFIRSKKIAAEKTTYTQSEIKKIIGDLREEHRSKPRPEGEDNSHYLSALGEQFVIEEGIVKVLTVSTGKKAYLEPICNGIIEITEEVTIEGPQGTDKVLKGEIRIGEKIYPYSWPIEKFSSNQFFPEELHRTAGADIQFKEIERLRQFAKAYSKPKKSLTSRILGWNPGGTVYFTRSVRIDKESISVNDEKKIEMPPNYVANHLDFKVVDRASAIKSAKIFISNFEALQDAGVTYFVLAHGFLAPVHAKFSNMPRTILWLYGRTGDGKSFIVMILMNLFGDFPQYADDRKVPWTSSPKFIAEQGSLAKDVPFYVEDYKNSNIAPSDRRQIATTLSNIFDGSGRGTLKRDRSLNAQAIIRGLTMSTGEDLAQLDAAGNARTSVVPVSSKPRNCVAGKILLEHLPEFKGIMPYYIHWALNQDLKHYQNYYEKQKGFLWDHIIGAQNDLRIATMAGQYGLGFRMMADFLVNFTVWTNQEAEEKCVKFEAILKDHVRYMSILAVEEQGSNRFLRILGSLLAAGEVRIHGLDADSDPLIEDQGSLRGKVGRFIGFTKNGNEHQNTVYINPDLAINSVETFLKGSDGSLGFSKQAVGEQLKNEGHFSRNDFQSGNTVRVRWKTTSAYYWPLKPRSLGLSILTVCSEPPAPPSAEESEGAL